MKKLMLGILGLLICANAYAALEFKGSYDYFKEPNNHNYDDAQGVTLGLEHPLYKDLNGRVDLSYMTDIDFPSVDDVKGSFGELRGYGATYNLVLRLPYNDKVTFSLEAGAGPYWWNFRENPFLQDNNVKVDVDMSLAFKVGGGVEYKLKDDWTLGAHIGWFDTNIDKDARDNTGREWNILDDDQIGLQYYTGRVEFKKRW